MFSVSVFFASFGLWLSVSGTKEKWLPQGRKQPFNQGLRREGYPKLTMLMCQSGVTFYIDNRKRFYPYPLDKKKQPRIRSCFFLKQLNVT